MYRFRDNAAYFTIEAGVNWDTVFSDTSTHYIFVSVAAGNFQAGDTIRVDVTRNAGDAGDTINSILILDGVSVTYTGLVSNTLGYALPYATTLPTSPTDGQVAVLVDNVINPTYQWQFRYNAASTSAYKWEFIGGTDLYATVAATESSATIGWFDLATVGPRVFIPRNGDYDLWAGAGNAAHTAANSTTWLGTALGTANPAGPGASVGSIGGGTDRHFNTSGQWLGLTAGADLRVRYYNGTTGTATWTGRWLRIRPIRVS
jgi:hypothetical protein